MDHLTALTLLDTALNVTQDFHKIFGEFVADKEEFNKLSDEFDSRNSKELEGVLKVNEELDNKIMEMESELANLEIAHSNESKVLSVKQNKAEEEEIELKMLQDIKIQYANRLAKASAMPSKKDLELLSRCQKKLKAYASMTGVAWDFSNCDSKHITGYIRNTTDTKMKIFNVNIENKSREEISSEMWELIKKCSNS